MKRLLFITSALVAAALVVLSCTKEPETPAVSAVTINSTLTLTEGQEKALDVVFTPSGSTGTLVWRTSDSDKVGVSNGVVSAREATDSPVDVWCLCGEIKSNVCKVTVEKRIEHITAIGFDKTSLDMKQGEIAELTVVLTPETTTDTEFTVSSTDEAVVGVAVNGKSVTLTAKGLGTCDVVVASTADPKITGKCTIAVTRDMYNKDGSYILYDDMISTNAMMTYGTVNHPSASGVGLINGEANYPLPWWQYKDNPSVPQYDDRELFAARKTKLALPSNLSDGDLTTCFMTNTDIWAPGEWQFNATRETGSFGYVRIKIWGKGLEYFGADLYPNWEGNYSDDNVPLVCSTENLSLPSLVADHYVQIELPETVSKVDMEISNSQDPTVYFRESGETIDKVVIMLSDDGETFRSLSAKSFSAGKIDAKGVADPNGNSIKFIRLTHNGTTSMTREYNNLDVWDWTVSNAGWHHTGSKASFTGNASPIAFAEIKVTKAN